MNRPVSLCRSSRTPAADCDTELALWRAGYARIAGIDEVGRGPLAGPVVAAAVILPPYLDADWLPFVRDSKALTARQRERLDRLIRRDAMTFGIGVQSAECIDQFGLSHATRLAVTDALNQLTVEPQFLLLDAFVHRPSDLNQIALIKGDARCLSIACASIIAKVARDQMLCELDVSYPGYGFAAHKGYGTSAHLDALSSLGPCPIHRRTFAPVRDNCT
jgi:ribonuclease HII